MKNYKVYRIILIVFTSLSTITAFSFWKIHNQQTINHTFIEAVKRQNIPAVLQALQAGADVNTRDGCDSLNVQLSHFLQRLQHGKSPSDFHPTALLLAMGYTNTGKPPLVAEPDLTLIKTLLKHGAEVDARGGYGYTALHFAGLCAEDDIIRLLVDHGAAVNLPDDTGETVLHYAATCEDPTIFAFLLNKGGDPNIVGHSGSSVLLCAVINANGSPLFSR